MPSPRVPPTSEPDIDTRIAREALLARLTVLFGQRDNTRILEAMRADVEIEVPGKSPLAGHHHGPESVRRFLVGLQRVFVPVEKPIEYTHAGDEMIMCQQLRAKTTEWTHRYRIRFDESGRIESIVFEADHIDAFDALVASAFATDRPVD